MMDEVQNIGIIIQRQRNRLGLTLRNIAEKSGVSISNLSRIEKANHYPSVEILRKIAKPLDFDETELFNLAGYLPVLKSKETALKKHNSLAELDILINRITADLNHIRSIARELHRKS
jgi:transcriptional regulator with XRE-family HTH domain